MFKSVLSKISQSPLACGFHTTACLNEVQLLTRLRVVDNSEIGKRAMAEGKPPKVICVYNKKRKIILRPRYTMVHAPPCAIWSKRSHYVWSILHLLLAIKGKMDDKTIIPAAIYLY